MENKSILEESLSLVNGERQDNYGDPVKCMERTMAIFYAISGIKLETRHVPLFNIAQKLAREYNKPSRDNKVDIAGYLHIMALTEQKEKTNG